MQETSEQYEDTKKGDALRHLQNEKSRKRDSNPRPTHYECVALPTELFRRSTHTQTLKSCAECCAKVESILRLTK